MTGTARVGEREPIHHDGSAERFNGAHPVDIAEALNRLDIGGADRALTSLPFDLAARVLDQPECERRGELLGNLPSEEACRSF